MRGTLILVNGGSVRQKTYTLYLSRLLFQYRYALGARSLVNDNITLQPN